MENKVKQNKAKGFIALYRSAFDNPELQDEGMPFDLFHAWFDLVASANHIESEIRVRGETLAIERGQHFTSIRKLAARWNWSEKKVRGTLNRWEKAKMISVLGAANGTLLTVTNYEVYNGSRRTKRRTDYHTEGHTEGRTDCLQTIIYNNIYNNDLNNEKEKRAAPVLAPGGEVLEE